MEKGEKRCEHVATCSRVCVCVCVRVCAMAMLRRLWRQVVSRPLCASGWPTSAACSAAALTEPPCPWFAGPGSDLPAVDHPSGARGRLGAEKHSLALLLPASFATCMCVYVSYLKF